MISYTEAISYFILACCTSYFAGLLSILNILLFQHPAIYKEMSLLKWFALLDDNETHGLKRTARLATVAILLTMALIFCGAGCLL